VTGTLAREESHAMSEGQALRVLRVTGGAVLVLFIALMLGNPGRPVTANTPGFMDPVVGLELASRPEHVFGILGAPTAPERNETVRRTVLVTKIDFLFLLAYPALHLGIAGLLIAAGGVSRPVATVLVALPVVMAVCDALENREILVLTALLEPASMEPVLTRLRLFTVLKWGALYLESALVAALVWRRPEWWRWSAAFFGLGALLGLFALVHPAAIEWSMLPLGIAWTMTLVRAFGRPSGALSAP
jgi:hypothetical protein